MREAVPVTVVEQIAPAPAGEARQMIEEVIDAPKFAHQQEEAKETKRQKRRHIK